MADNYLEKQYESYEARKAAWEKAKKLGKKHPTQSDIKKMEEDKEKKEYENDIADNDEE